MDISLSLYLPPSLKSVKIKKKKKNFKVCLKKCIIHNNMNKKK